MSLSACTISLRSEKRPWDFGEGEVHLSPLSSMFYSRAGQASWHYRPIPKYSCRKSFLCFGWERGTVQGGRGSGFLVGWIPSFDAEWDWVRYADTHLGNQMFQLLQTYFLPYLGAYRAVCLKRSLLLTTYCTQTAFSETAEWLCWNLKNELAVDCSYRNVRK